MTDHYSHTKMNPGQKETALSGEFFHSYRKVREFPAAGGEADIWLVQNEHDFFVLKHYRKGIEPKKMVLEIISQISRKNPQHLIRIFEHGYDEQSGRWFEILEYARYGSLRDLLKAGPVPQSSVRTILENITASLTALHENNILHLDLKPSNILLRGLHPLDLILTDFGISTLLDQDLTRHITSTKGTPMYWAPEQMGNVVGKEADFWALGVIILEILQRRHPFEGLNHNLILSTLSTRGIEIPDTLPPDYTLLLQGLLTRDPHKRWGQKEVSHWLSGRRNIPVYYGDKGRKAGKGRGYEFRSENYDNLTDLIYAFLSSPESWEDAKQHIGRGYLTRWLEQSDQFDQAVLVERMMDTYPDPDECLLAIATECSREIPFTLLGRLIDAANITEMLGRYLKGEHDETSERILSMLISGEIERIYATYSAIAKRTEGTLLPRLFSWVRSHQGRGIEEKEVLYDYTRALQEREAVGSPEDWDTRAVLRVMEIRDQFYQIGAYADSTACEEDLVLSCEHTLRTGSEPDLSVACASVLEEIKKPEYSTRCLKKAAESDVHAITLLFSGKRGFVRFRLYNQLLKEYETNLYSLSSDPWNQQVNFWFSRFFLLLREEAFARALSVSERIIEMEPANADGWAMRGFCLGRLNRPNEAEFFFTRKEIQVSESPLVWQFYGEHCEGLQKTEEAAEKFRRSLSLNPTQTGSLLGLVRISISTKKFQEAIELCDQILVHHPENMQARFLKGEALFAKRQVKEATRVYQEIVSLDATFLPARKKLARCLVMLKRYPEAYPLLDSLLSEQPPDPEVVRLKVFVLLKEGRRAEALPYLEESLKRDPDNRWSLQALLSLSLSRNQIYPALGYLDRLIRRYPDEPRFYEKKGRIFLSMGFFAQAAELFLKAIDRGVKTPEIYTAAGDAVRLSPVIRYGGERFLSSPPIEGSPSWSVTTSFLDLWDLPTLERDQIDTLMQALSWYDAALSLQDTAPAWNGKGIISTLLQDYVWADTFFSTASHLDGQNRAYQANSAAVRALSGDLDGSERVYQQLIRAYPEDPDLFSQYAAWKFRFLGDAEAAYALLTRTEFININRDPIMVQHASLLLWELGRVDEAREMAEKIPEIDPWFVQEPERVDR